MATMSERLSFSSEMTKTKMIHGSYPVFTYKCEHVLARLPASPATRCVLGTETMSGASPAF